MNKVFTQYKQFVNGVTSEDSLNNEKFIERVMELNKSIPFSKMDTAVSGIAGEAGEIADLWKKIKFHGKPYNDENRDKMISELGDMFWYLSHAMECLGVDVEDVLDRNVEKLQSRYPGSKFTIDASENRHTKIHGEPIQTPQARVVDNAVQEHLDRLGHTPEESPRASKGATEAEAEFNSTAGAEPIVSTAPYEEKKKSLLSKLFS